MPPPGLIHILEINNIHNKELFIHMRYPPLPSVTINTVSEMVKLVFYTTELFQTADSNVRHARMGRKNNTRLTQRGTRRR